MKNGVGVLTNFLVLCMNDNTVMMKFGPVKRYFICLAALGMLAVSSVSCVKKGEEDPIISFRSRTSRLMGQWDVQQIKISEFVDLMDYAVPGESKNCQKEFVNTTSIDDMLLNFRENGEVDVMRKSEARLFNQDSCAYQAFTSDLDQLEAWSFNEDETKLLISNDNGQNLTHQEYEIVGLSNNEMTLSFDVVLNLLLDADGNILHYDAPQVYTATMVLEKLD